MISQLIGLALAAVLLTSCAESTEPGCQTDLECKGDRICIEGACVDPERDGENEADEDDAAPPKPRDRPDAAPDASHDAAAHDGGADAACDDPSCADAGPSKPEDARTPRDAGPVTPGSDRAVSVEHYLTSRFILADRTRKRLYASIDGLSGKYPNTLVTIDGESGEVIANLPVGSEPSTLAMSDDGSTLWVSISVAFAIRRIDLTGSVPTAHEQHALPVDTWKIPA